jgi:hypothetical protein
VRAIGRRVLERTPSKLPKSGSLKLALRITSMLKSKIREVQMPTTSIVQICLFSVSGSITVVP